jgi:hypothetical protein
MTCRVEEWAWISTLGAMQLQEIHQKTTPSKWDGRRWQSEMLCGDYRTGVEFADFHTHYLYSCQPVLGIEVSPFRIVVVCGGAAAVR